MIIFSTAKNFEKHQNATIAQVLVNFTARRLPDAAIYLLKTTDQTDSYPTSNDAFVIAEAFREAWDASHEAITNTTTNTINAPYFSQKYAASPDFDTKLSKNGN